MNNLIRAEGYKLLRNRTFWLLLLVLAAAAVVNVLLARFDDPNDGGAIDALSGIDAWTSSLAANPYIIKIGFGILAGFFLSSEYANGTMKRSVSAGFPRSRIIAAKLTVFSLGAMGAALVYPLVNLVLGSLVLGFGELPGGSEAEYIVRTLGMTLLVAAAFAAVTGWFAILLNDSGKTIGFSFVFFFFIDGVILMASKYAPALETVYDYSILRVILDLANESVSRGDLLVDIAICLLTWVAFVGLGIVVFRRKEIK
ncbi:ABC transporter permease [Cohnella fermenti]|uniref:ABC transporter permease n=1 Tax=Cohnella fermenti TaxID=2565925 RepID=A0A4S4BWK1_9BACL|nr:ABC transporter permease [Cohnella fermenti]THF79565.1 ABC transporter permease [Cohnella fermenti]